MRPIRYTNIAFISLFAVVCVILFEARSAAAQSLSTEWSNGLHSRVRLTAANLLGDGNDMTLYAGVDIRLDENWKTYWIAPGEGGGIPPEFDWSRSQNVRSIRVMYPVPKLLKDKYGDSIGYKGKILFPVGVTPDDPSRPVRLRLHIYFGVCEEVCIPAEATLALDVPPGARANISEQRDLMIALAKVPGSASNDVEIKDALAVLNGRSPHLLVTVQPRDPNMRTSLFLASRDGDYFPIPKPVERSQGGETVFRIDLSHMDKPQSLAGKTVDLTGTADDKGVSKAWTIAAAGAN